MGFDATFVTCRPGGATSIVNAPGGRDSRIDTHGWTRLKDRHMLLDETPGSTHMVGRAQGSIHMVDAFIHSARGGVHLAPPHSGFPLILKLACWVLVAVQICQLWSGKRPGFSRLLRHHQIRV